MSRRPPPNMPRSKFPRSKNGKSSQPVKHYPHCRCDYDWYDWDDYDYDWDDYDYDWYDYDRRYFTPRRFKGAGPLKTRSIKNNQNGYEDPCLASYQEGFRDGWYSAMEYVVYDNEITESTEIIPTPPPPPPMDSKESNKGETK